MGLLKRIERGLGFRSEKAKFTQPKEIGQFTSPFGTSTATGFTRAASADQGNVNLARQGLTGILEGGLQATPERLQAFQDARQAELLSAFDPEQQRREQQQAVRSASRGTSGSSADLMRESLLEQQGTRGRADILNRAIQGREDLANQALQQNLAQAGLFQGLTQQDFSNQLAGFGATQQALRGTTADELARTGMVNQLEQARVSGINQGRTAGLRNLIGAGTAIVGGYNAFGGGGGGGGFGGNTMSPSELSQARRQSGGAF